MDEKINEWKVATHVLLTLVVLLVIQQILLEANAEKTAEELYIMVGGLYQFACLFLGIFLTYKLKKIIELVYCLALVFVMALFAGAAVWMVLTWALSIGYFYVSYHKLEERKLNDKAGKM